MKRAIITGATGMLGIALIHRLLQENIEVTAVIRPQSSRTARIPKDEKVHIVECDLVGLRQLYKQLNYHYDYFFHFAWDGTYGDSRNDMFLQTKNIKATLDAVELAHSLGCEVFVGAGSQAEYGRFEGKLKPDMPTKPQTGYGMAKLCAGQMSRVVSQRYGMRHIWMRILSTYGPNDGMHTMVISGMLQMLEKKVPKYTKGEQMWDYLYCDDAAEAFYLASQKGIDGSVYCLGSGQARPLCEYIKDIRDVVSPQSDINFGAVPYYPNQVMYLCADITALERDTGFTPKVSFKEGIKKTEKWLKEEMSHEKN